MHLLYRKEKGDKNNNHFTSKIALDIYAAKMKVFVDEEQLSIFLLRYVRRSESLIGKHIRLDATRLYNHFIFFMGTSLNSS